MRIGLNSIKRRDDIMMRSEKYIVKKKRKRKKLYETILSLVLLLAIFLGAVTGYYSSKIMSFLDGISADNNDNDIETLENSKQLEDLEPFSALILGIDIEEGGASRSDTIIVATVNPKSKDIKMVSIPRDALVTLPNGVEEKINAAHSVGGPLLAKEMIASYLDIPIQFYATMDFDGLIELVDAVGGVDVDSDLAFTQGNYRTPSEPVEITEGDQHLNGEEALAYARMRKKDPRGDFGRQDRQQEVMINILEKLSSFNTVTNLTSILDSIEPYLHTNATGSQMISVASNYSMTITNIEQLTLDGYAETKYFPHYGLDVYTWEPYEESLIEVQDELKTHLGLETSDTESMHQHADESEHAAESEITIDDDTNGY